MRRTKCRQRLFTCSNPIQNEIWRKEGVGDEQQAQTLIFRSHPPSHGSSWTQPYLPRPHWPWLSRRFSAKTKHKVISLITTWFYLNPSSSKLVSLDLSYAMVFSQIDDLDSIGCDQACAGQHLWPHWAVSLHRSVPSPLLLWRGVFSIWPSFFSFSEHLEPRTILGQLPHLEVGLLLEPGDHLGGDPPHLVVVLDPVPRSSLGGVAQYWSDKNQFTLYL